MTPRRKSIHKPRPTLLDREAIEEIVYSDHEASGEHIIIRRDMGMLRGNPRIFRRLALQKAPFIINDHRMGIILRGTGVTNVNLVDRELHAGMFIYASPGSILTPKSFSDDFEIFGIALFEGFTMPFATGSMPPAFNGHAREMIMEADETDLHTAHRILDALWSLAQPHDFPRPVASSLVAALMQLYDNLYHRHAVRSSGAGSQGQGIFDRFIRLVNLHCAEQHHLAFYADRICLTERYLSSVVSQTSGVSAKEWIDRALVMRIKVELLHTDKAVARIADDLSFPNPSFFCKYFKRLVGITPGEYRQSKAAPQHKPQDSTHALSK